MKTYVKMNISNFAIFILLSVICGFFVKSYFVPKAINAKDIQSQSMHHLQVLSLENDAKVAELFVPSNSGAILNLNDANGKERLQLGSYNDSVSKEEKGLPMIGLMDNNDRVRMLFRLAGKNQSPVIILKDTNNVDRLIMGLDLDGPKQNPFIIAVDEEGKRNAIVGKY